MWGIFGKPLKRAIWNTLGLHAVLMTCLRFSSLLDDACVACCLLLSTGSYHVCTQIHATCCHFPRCTTETFGAQKSALWGANWVKVTWEPARQAKKPYTTGSQQLHAQTRNTRFCPAQFWDCKDHAANFWRLALTLIWSRRLHMKVARSTPERGGIKQRILYLTTGPRRQICKTQFLHYFKISRFVVESVAKAKAAAAVATPLSPMKSPQKQVAVNTRRMSTIKLRFKQFLQGLPQAENCFSDAARPHTDMVHSGWVAVKSRSLQDWQKLKKYVPNNKHGDVCPNGVPVLPEKDDANDDSE